MKTDFKKERLHEECTDKDAKCRSVSWKVLRQNKVAAGATTYVGDTALTAPPFFDNAVRGARNMILWGPRAPGPRIIIDTIGPDSDARTRQLSSNTPEQQQLDSPCPG